MSAVRRVARLVPAATLALVLGGLASCQDGTTPAPAPAPSGSGTPLTGFDTSGLVVARADFCPAVAPAAVEGALGIAAAELTAYGNGDPAPLTPRLRDVAHEFSCTWEASEGIARAWVFAPPVSPARARGLVRLARREADCRPTPGAPSFGRPSVALTCGTGTRSEVSFRGLFGDAWLSCSLTAADSEELVDRTGRWCVAVAQAASGGAAAG